MTNGPRYLAVAWLVVFSLTAASAADAQLREEDTQNFVHYSYGVILGTGVYTLKDRTVAILRFPFAWQMWEGEEGSPIVRFTLPVALGLHDFEFDDPLEILDSEAATLAVTPGVEVDFLVSPRWRVTPFGNLGFGWDMTHDETAFIYGGGVRSLYQLPWKDERFALGGEALLAGHDPTEGPTKFLFRFGIGADSKWPIGWKLWDRRTYIAVNLIGYFYTSELEFETEPPPPIKIRETVQIGLALGIEDGPTILGYKLNRIGLAYEFGGQLDAIKIITRFPF